MPEQTNPFPRAGEVFWVETAITVHCGFKAMQFDGTKEGLKQFEDFSSEDERNYEFIEIPLTPTEINLGVKTRKGYIIIFSEKEAMKVMPGDYIILENIKPDEVKPDRLLAMYTVSKNCFETFFKTLTDRVTSARKVKK